jgi:glycosyltransferase involved in cell wall biosynthesis
VADYTRSIARGLAAKDEDVHVWAPRAAEGLASDPGVAVHSHDGYGPHGLLSFAHELSKIRGPRRILLQYVPHAFGMRAMNLPFCTWLATMRGAQVWVMFHEVAMPPRPWREWKKNAGAVVTRVMAGMLVSRADKIFVSIPAWEETLRQVALRWHGATWLPIPSNIPADDAANGRSRPPVSDRPVIGHFGTYGGSIRPLVKRVVSQLLHADAGRTALLVGRGGESLARELDGDPPLSGRVAATGALEVNAVADKLRACDLLVQPYPDGVSTRRTTVMAGLALGVPIATNDGHLTESVWRESDIVKLAAAPDGVTAAAEDVLRDLPRAILRAERGRVYYRERFSLEHSIETLRAAAAGTVAR